MADSHEQRQARLDVDNAEAIAAMNDRLRGPDAENAKIEISITRARLAMEAAERAGDTPRRRQAAEDLDYALKRLSALWARLARDPAKGVLQTDPERARKIGPAGPAIRAWVQPIAPPATP